MKIILLLAADYANITTDNKLNVMGIFNDINAIQFPTRLSSMHLIVKLEVELGDKDARTLTIKLCDPDGNELMNYSGQIQIPEGKGGRRPEVNAILNLRDIIFPTEFPQLRTTLPRHSAIAKGYVQYAVKLVESSIALKENQHGQETNK